MNEQPTPVTANAAPVRLPHAQPVLRVVPMPADVNQHGDIFGGWIMSQVDIAGGVLAARHARGRVATVAVNSFTFKQPVLVGDVVSFYGDVVRVGRTVGVATAEVVAHSAGKPDTCVAMMQATMMRVEARNGAGG